MNLKRFGAVAALAVAGSLVLASCASDGEPEPTGTTPPEVTLSGDLVGVGASSMGAGQTAWIAGFADLYPDVNVSYDPQGSGNGRTAFKEGGAQFGGSDRAFNVGELEGNAICAVGTKALDLPVWISPIAVIFNVDGIESINMDADTIAKVFAGDITNWNDPEIANQNAGVSLPNLAITRVVRSDNSGTTANFTDYLAKASSAWPADESFETWDQDWAASAERGDGTSGVVNAVKGGNGTIGYADASRAADLGTVAVKVGDEYVPYSPEAAAAVVDASPLEAGRDANDIVVALERDTTASGVYPIVLIAYALACQEYANADDAALVKAYLGYVASVEGQNHAATTAGNAPLSAEMSAKVLAVVDSIK